MRSSQGARGRQGRSDHEKPPRVLVLRFSSAGDIVLTAPALAALAQAWPRARIVFVTKEAFKDLARGLPHVSEVVALRASESIWSLRRRLAALAPVAVLDLHGKTRAWLLRGLAKRRHCAAWVKRAWWQSLAVHLAGRPYHAQMHIAARYHAAVERLVGRKLQRCALEYQVEPAAVATRVARLAAMLVDHPVDNSARAGRQLAAGAATEAFFGGVDNTVDKAGALLGFAPGAMWQTKRWPAERFAELARRGRAAGYQVVLTGSGAERALTAEIAASVPGAIDLAGQLDWRGLAEVVAACRAFVANDSGPMHLARALGVPTLTFFGSTDPRQFDFTGHAVLFANLPCSPCSFHGLRRCPRRHLRCLLDLDVEAAWAALQGLLAVSPTRATSGEALAGARAAGVLG